MDETKQQDTTVVLQFLPDKGIMSELIRNFAWHKTALGPIEHWPQSLRTIVSACLYSETAVLIMWGNELVQIYNDKYISVLGDKHPAALGQSAENSWGEIWPAVEPLLSKVIKERKSYHQENSLLLLNRFNFLEETYFTFSYSPVIAEQGVVGGVFVPVTDTTKQVIGLRQTTVLNGLSGLSAAAKNEKQLLTQTIEILSADPWDFCFAAIYELNKNKHSVTLSISTTNGVGLVPDQVSLVKTEGPAKLFGAALSMNAAVSGDFSDFSNSRMPSGAWESTSGRVMVLPLREGSATEIESFLVIGINPYHKEGSDFFAFYSLVAEHLSSALGNLHADDLERKQDQQIRNLFSQAPIAICILKGPQFFIEFANTRMLELWGKNSDILSMPLFEGLPDARNLIFELIVELIPLNCARSSAQNVCHVKSCNHIMVVRFFFLLTEIFYPDPKYAF